MVRSSGFRCAEFRIELALLCLFDHRKYDRRDRGFGSPSGTYTHDLATRLSSSTFTEGGGGVTRGIFSCKIYVNVPAEFTVRVTRPPWQNSSRSTSQETAGRINRKGWNLVRRKMATWKR